MFLRNMFTENILGSGGRRVNDLDFRPQEKHRRTQKKHTEETQKKHRRNTEEPQKNAEDTATVKSLEGHRSAAHAPPKGDRAGHHNRRP